MPSWNARSASCSGGSQSEKRRPGSAEAVHGAIGYRFLSSTPLEELDCTFVLLCGGTCPERPEIPPPPGPRIYLARVQAILARFQFANHPALLTFPDSDGLPHPIAWTGSTCRPWTRSSGRRAFHNLIAAGSVRCLHGGAAHYRWLSRCLPSEQISALHVMNPYDPLSAQAIVAEYVRVLEQHAETGAYPVPARTLPHSKPTIKAAIVTCVTALRQTDQLTDEMREFLESAYVALADYLDDELVRAVTEYRDATAALEHDTRTAREKVQTPAWQRLAQTSRLAGDIARSIVEESTSLRREFHASV